MDSSNIFMLKIKRFPFEEDTSVLVHIQWKLTVKETTPATCFVSALPVCHQMNIYGNKG